MFYQQRLRSACAYVQSDQSIRLSLEYYMTVMLLTEDNLESLSLKGGYTGSSECCQNATLLKISCTGSYQFILPLLACPSVRNSSANERFESCVNMSFLIPFIKAECTSVPVERTRFLCETTMPLPSLPKV